MGSSSINQARHGETICTLCLVRRYTKCAQKTHSLTTDIQGPQVTRVRIRWKLWKSRIWGYLLKKSVCINALVRIKDCLSDAQSFSSLDAVVYTAWKC